MAKNDATHQATVANDYFLTDIAHMIGLLCDYVTLKIHLQPSRAFMLF